MEVKKKDVIICLGSSCFARGNKQLVKVINDYLRDRNLLNEVRFHGERCFGQCAVGPSLKIDGMLKERLDEDSVIAILDEFFEKIGTKI
jgi:NADH:ubiquinone oxidoreductase subunit E